MADDSYTIGKGGLQDAYKGNDFQFKILQLFSLKAYNQKLNFKVWTEDKTGEKFDDVLFSCVENKKTRFTLLQAKHKAKILTLNFSTFFMDIDYSLYKYFQSYLAIVENFQIDYKSCYLEDLVICTNNVFPVGSSTISDPNFPANQFHFEIPDSHRIFSNEGVLYRFSSAQENGNLNVFKQKFLMIELASFLCDANPKNSILQYSKYFLLAEVFHVNRNSLTFRKEFLQSKVLISSMKEVFDCNFVKTKPEQKAQIDVDFVEFLKNTLKKSSGKVLNQLNDINHDENLVNQKVKTFMRKLLFVTKLTMPQIDKSIEIETLKIVKDVKQSKISYLKFNDSIKKWLMEPANSVDQEFRAKINFETVGKCFQSEKRPEIEFSQFSQELRSFVDLNEKIWVYEVVKNEVDWGSIRLQQLNDSLIQLENKKCDFDKILEILDYSSEEFQFVVEYKEDENLLALKEFLSNFEIKSNGKLVIVCDEDSSKSFPNYKKFQEVKLLCGDLTEASLDHLLEKKLIFQGFSVRLNELIGKEKIQRIPLQELNQIAEIGTPLIPPDIYLPRKFQRKIYLTPSLLEDSQSNVLQDLLTFTVGDFKSALNGHAVHLLEKFYSQSGRDADVVDKLLWKRSYRSIKKLRRYVNENEIWNTLGTEFSSNLSQMNILTDVPGMGKSVFMEQLAMELKGKFEKLWIQKIDLQLFHDECASFEKENFDCDDLERIRNYFCENFMKFETALELEVFKSLLSEGKVILLLDGFDEIEPHKTTIMTIVSALLEASDGNKFFITSRTEWAQLLEDRFLQFTYFFHPFSRMDQKEFLLQFWEKNEDEWKRFADQVLDELNKSLTEREKVFCGIPLITKLVGEYFLDSQSTGSVQLTNLSLFHLLSHYVDKKFLIYCTEKLKLKKTSNFTISAKKSLYKDHQILALKLLFPNNFKALNGKEQSFDENVLRECGLVQDINGQFRFHHQTSAEFMATDYFKENFEDVEILKFIFEEILVKNGFQMMRVFINCCIGEVMVDRIKRTVKELLKENPQVLSVAAKEGNLETFMIMFEISTNDLEAFDPSEILMRKDDDGFNMFYYFFHNCELSEDFLSDLKEKFGLDFVRKILELKNGPKNTIALYAASLQGKNYLPVSKFLIKNFPDDRSFVSAQILLDGHGMSILHNATEKLCKETFLALLQEVKKFDEKLLKALLLKLTIDDENFMHSLVLNMPRDRPEVEKRDTLIEIVEWLHLNTSDAYKIAIDGDVHFDSLFHKVAEHFSDELLVLLKYLCKTFNSYEILLNENRYGEVFLEKIPTHYKGRVIPKILEILEWLKDSDVTTLNKIVFNKDSSMCNLIHRLCASSNKENLAELLIAITDWLSKNFSNFNVVDFLKEQDEDGWTCLSYIVRNDPKNQVSMAISKIFDWVHQIDQQLLRDILEFKQDWGETFVQNLCKNSRKRDVLNNLKTLISWIEVKYGGNLDAKELLRGTDKFGRNFLHFILVKDYFDEATPALCETLQWVQDIDNNLLIELINSTTSYGRNFLHNLCWGTRKKNLLVLLKAVVEWLENNLKGFDRDSFLRARDKQKKTLLYYIDLHNKTDEAKAAKIEVEKWLKEINLSF